MATIIGIDTFDVRFPTSASLDGSDAMHPDPDYSAAYVVLETDGDRWPGSGLDVHASGAGTNLRPAIDAVADS